MEISMSELFADLMKEGRTPLKGLVESVIFLNSISMNDSLDDLLKEYSASLLTVTEVQVFLNSFFILKDVIHSNKSVYVVDTIDYMTNRVNIKNIDSMRVETLPVEHFLSLNPKTNKWIF